MTIVYILIGLVCGFVALFGACFQIFEVKLLDSGDGLIFWQNLAGGISLSIVTIFIWPVLIVIIGVYGLFKIPLLFKKDEDV